VDIKTTNYKRCTVVEMSGRIDSHSAPELQKAFEAITGEDKFKIVFDMNDVNFISSRGVWVLIETQKECKRYNRGLLVLANVNDKIMDSLDLAGLQEFFKIYPNVTDAVGSF
jgi:anti-sigma B factor antagonist